MADAESCDNLQGQAMKFSLEISLTPRTSLNLPRAHIPQAGETPGAAGLQSHIPFDALDGGEGKIEKLHERKSQGSLLRGALCSEGTLSGTLITSGTKRTG